MSDLNFNWVKENFETQENFVFFDIGCAILKHSSTSEMQKILPNGKYYAFEAANHWNDINGECDNKEYAKEAGINYYHCAVSDIDGEIDLIPSLTENGQRHPWSSSIFKMNDATSTKIYGNPYSVKSIRLETFCKENNVTPDFIHIDVEGAELKVFKNIGQYKPKFIWAETCTFQHYDTKITTKEFHKYMESIGYHIISYSNGNDTLYGLDGFKTTPYCSKFL
jgi:FkbM family methyltransferase